MLTYDALVEQARQRGMPAGKMRGALREYLQALILKEIYRAEKGAAFYFTGGTYLRMLHNLKRFSEDLDFNTDRMTKRQFEDVIRAVGVELERNGLEPRLSFEHWGSLYRADLIFPELEKEYGVVSKHSKKEGISIKVEMHRPKWKITKETGVVSGFGEFYPCVCTAMSALFSDKIDALRKKTRGRHLYDIFFLLSHQCPIDRKVLAVFGITGDPLRTIRERVESFSEKELEDQAETLRPFLFDESEADLIAKAPLALKALLERYNPEIADKSS